MQYLGIFGTFWPKNGRNRPKSERFLQKMQHFFEKVEHFWNILEFLQHFCNICFTSFLQEMQEILKSERNQTFPFWLVSPIKGNVRPTATVIERWIGNITVTWPSYKEFYLFRSQRYV